MFEEISGSFKSETCEGAYIRMEGLKHHAWDEFALTRAIFGLQKTLRKDEDTPLLPFYALDRRIVQTAVDTVLVYTFQKGTFISRISLRFAN